MEPEEKEILLLRELSRDLVRDFLLAEGFAVNLPEQIVLYGCPRHILLLMTYLMKKEFAEQSGVSIKVRAHTATASAVPSDSYCIDVGYFVGHTFRAKTPALATIDCRG